MVSIHRKMARLAAVGRAAQKDVARMLRVKRLGIRAARALADSIKEQEQYEQFVGTVVPDEWAPFLGFAEPQLFSFDRGDEEEEEEEESLEPAPVTFAQYAKPGKGGATLYMRTFDSVRDYCAQPYANEANRVLFERRDGDGQGGFKTRDRKPKENQVSDHETLSDMDWYGAATANEAAQRAFKGWPEGAERIRELMQDVEAPPPVSLRRKTQRADQGDEIDIHEVYRGGLDRAWSRKRRQHSRSRMSIRLVASIGGHIETKGERIFWRGAAVAKLAEVLEESGYRVEVIGANSHYVNVSAGNVSAVNSLPCIFATFMVKGAGDPIDLEQLAGVLCNAGFARTWGFKDAYTILPEEIQMAKKLPVYEWRKVLGKHTRYEVPGKFRVEGFLFSTGMDPVEVGALAADGTKTFRVPLGIGDVESAQAWVKKCLAEIGNGEEQGSAQDG